MTSADVKAKHRAAIVPMVESGEPRRLNAGSWSGSPVERTFLECIYIGYCKNACETTHAPESHVASGSEFTELHGPRVKKHDLDIKNDKQHRDEVEFDTEAGRSLSNGKHAALVGRILGGVFAAFFAENNTHNQHTGAKADGNQGLHDNG